MKVKDLVNLLTGWIRIVFQDDTINEQYYYCSFDKEGCKSEWLEKTIIDIARTGNTDISMIVRVK